MSILTGDNPFAIAKERMLNEGLVRAFMTAVKSAASKIKSLINLGFGKRTKIKISVPIDLNENAATQTGKTGGEYAEFIIMSRLYDYLSTHNFHELSLLIDGKNISRENFEIHLKEHHNRVQRADKSKLSQWMKVGLAGAKDLYGQLKDVAEESEVFQIAIEATGVSLTGREKADMIIHVKKINEDDFENKIKLSLKASLGEPWIFNGTQAGEENTLLQLSSGFTITETKDNLKKKLNIDELESAVNDLKELVKEDPVFKNDLDIARKNLSAANSIYKELIKSRFIDMYDSLGVKHEVVENIKSMINNIGESNRQRSVYNKETREIVAERNKVESDIKALKKQNKDTSSLELEYQRLYNAVKSRDEFKMKTFSNDVAVEQGKLIDVFQSIINKLIEKDKKQFISNLLKFAGVESGLDYLIIGIEKSGSGKNKRTFGKSFINTLKKPNYAKKIEKVFSDLEKNNLDVTVRRDRHNSVHCNIIMDGQTITVIPVEHHANNMRIMGFEIKKFYDNT